MASLNLSINGPSIKSSYAGVVESPASSSSSPTYAKWALFSVQAPLMNAFQDSGAKESILKVENTGDGELTELIEDFSEGRMQFAFLKVKDPNSALPKNVLIAWCGGGVPERTKGYFTSHLNAVAKVLHGYHVQITARSDSDLEPAAIMQKVADASGSKYSAGSGGGASSAAAAGPPPPIKSKPVFTPTSSSAGRFANPIVAARSQRGGNVDADGWGDDAPPVTRTTVERVESAYKPTKVNMGQLTSQQPEPSGLSAASARTADRPDVVKGAYEPVGRVDIAAIRAAAKEKSDDRPTIVKGAYEPVGKVDIAAIRAKAQPSSAAASRQEQESEEAPRPLADRASAFSQPSQSERLTSLPKPKVANQFGGPSSFTGTKAPVPGGLGFGQPAAASATPNVATASRTFADQGGKTPAQIWAEKKAKERGGAPAPAASESTTTTKPVVAQTSGSGWQSGYTGKSWAPVQTPSQFGRPDPGQLSAENTGEMARGSEQESAPAPAPALSAESGGVSAIRDRFKDAAPMGSSAPPVPRGGFAQDDDRDDRDDRDGRDEEESTAPAPPVPVTSRPSGGFAIPGLPSRPAVPAEEEEEEEEEDRSAYEREETPPRVAIPVSRGPETGGAPEPDSPPGPVETARHEKTEEEPPHIPTREAVPDSPVEPASHAGGGGKRALIQFDYDKAEGNEIDLVEGEYVSNIDMVAEDWWMGTNSRGEVGLFPSNYVELEEDGHDEAPAPPVIHEPEPEPEPAAAAAPGSGQGRTATALYDYEAAEDNELSFHEDAKITNLDFPDEDWWVGEFNGHTGLFPANYVRLDD